MQEAIKRNNAVWFRYNQFFERFAAENKVSQSLLYVYVAFEAYDFEVSNRELVSYTGLPKQTISTLLKKMLKQGQVEFLPHPTDGRSKICRLTRGGKAKAELILAKLHRRERDAVEKLGQEKMALLNTLNEKLVNYLNEGE